MTDNKANAAPNVLLVKLPLLMVLHSGTSTQSEMRNLLQFLAQARSYAN